MKEAIASVAPKSCACICLALNPNLCRDKFRSNEAVFRALERVLKIPFFQFQQDTTSSVQFVEEMEQVNEHARTFNRTCLLVAGGYLDEHVTAAVVAAPPKVSMSVFFTIL